MIVDTGDRFWAVMLVLGLEAFFDADGDFVGQVGGCWAQGAEQARGVGRACELS